jgi:hypothetical protein
MQKIKEKLKMEPSQRAKDDAEYIVQLHKGLIKRFDFEEAKEIVKSAVFGLAFSGAQTLEGRNYLPKHT